MYFAKLYKKCQNTVLYSAWFRIPICQIKSLKYSKIQTVEFSKIFKKFSKLGKIGGINNVEPSCETVPR